MNSVTSFSLSPKGEETKKCRVAVFRAKVDFFEDSLRQSFFVRKLSVEKL